MEGDRMSVIPIVAALLLAGATQDKDRSPSKDAKGEKSCCVDGVPKPWEAYNEGVTWTQPPEKAYEKARAECKPVLVFYLVGDMDKEGC
jgi:hypothetical protein